MTNLDVAALTLLSALTGLAIAGIVGLCIIANHLADLKAYTMTQIDLLQQLVNAIPPELP